LEVLQNPQVPQKVIGKCRNASAAFLKLLAMAGDTFAVPALVGVERLKPTLESTANRAPASLGGIQFAEREGLIHSSNKPDSRTRSATASRSSALSDGFRTPTSMPAM